MVNDIRAAMDNRLITVVVLFDFFKAFDLVNHDLLLEKLQQMVCSDDVVVWFRSYLTGRVQAVKLSNGTTSSWHELLTWVSQGSVFGPLLFSIFINSIAFVLKYCQYLLFADDLQIYLHDPASEIDQLLAKIDIDMQAINNGALSLFKLN